jgi:hypothetical protein
MNCFGLRGVTKAIFSVIRPPNLVDNIPVAARHFTLDETVNGRQLYVSYQGNHTLAVACNGTWK